jgi:hypothetical protein
VHILKSESESGMQQVYDTQVRIGMPKFGSVWFLKDFAKPRTGLQVTSSDVNQVWSRQSAEL